MRQDASYGALLAEYSYDTWERKRKEAIGPDGFLAVLLLPAESP